MAGKNKKVEVSVQDVKMLLGVNTEALEEVFLENPLDEVVNLSGVKEEVDALLDVVVNLEESLVVAKEEVDAQLNVVVVSRPVRSWVPERVN